MMSEEGSKDTINDSSSVTATGKEIANFKAALYIDGNDDDTMISDYIKTAKQYVQNAVSPTADLTKYQQYDFAVQMLSQFWYQNRGIDMVKTPYQVLSMIQQLRGMVD